MKTLTNLAKIYIKTIIHLFLIFPMLGLLAGCGDDEQAQNPTSETIITVKIDGVEVKTDRATQTALVDMARAICADYSQAYSNNIKASKISKSNSISISKSDQMSIESSYAAGGATKAIMEAQKQLMDRMQKENLFTSYPVQFLIKKETIVKAEGITQNLTVTSAGRAESAQNIQFSCSQASDSSSQK